MPRSIVPQHEQYGLPLREAHPHEFKPYVDAPEYCSQELYETGDTCNRSAEDHEPHHREARTLPPASEVSDLLAGPRITTGLMKREAAGSGYLSPWEEGPQTEEMQKQNEILLRGEDRRFPDDSTYSKPNAVYYWGPDRHMDWGHRGPGASDQRGIRP